MGGSTTCGNAGTTTLAYNSTITPTTDRPGILRITPSTNTSSGATIMMSQTSGGSMVLSPGNYVKTAVAVASATSRPTNSGLWREADPANNANWEYCYATGAR